MSAKIVLAGDNCVDYYDREGRYSFGGNPLNVAVYASSLGLQSSYIGAVGDDEFGAGMVAALAGKGVEISHLRRLPGKTALTHVTLVNGERVFGEYEEGVMGKFRLSEADFDFIAEHQLFCSGLWSHTEKDLARVRSLGVTVAFDFADRPDSDVGITAMPHTDLAFFSDDLSDVETLRQRLAYYCALGPKWVIATRGDKGSLALVDGAYYEQGIVPCAVVDTMGAGDSYIAAFLAAYLDDKTRPISEYMQKGAAFSAKTLSAYGAWS